MKPWKTSVGLAVGLVIGVLVWWSSYVPADGLLQKPQLVVVPAAFGILIVNIRNRRKKVGPYDLEVIARNKRGRV